MGRHRGECAGARHLYDAEVLGDLALRLRCDRDGGRGRRGRRCTTDKAKGNERGGMGFEAVNGGILAAMFDLVLGASVALVDPTRRSATMQLSMSFMRGGEC